MSSNTLNALAAYKNANIRPLNETTGPAMPVNPTSGAGTFSKLLDSIVDKAVSDQKESERMAMQAVAGKADLQDVVLAVSNAEVALDTVVAVRDKVVSAYQEIMRMPI